MKKENKLFFKIFFFCTLIMGFGDINMNEMISYKKRK